MSLFFHSQSALSDNLFFDFMPDSSLVNDFSRAYGFFIGQNLSLDRIQKQFPELNYQCIKAKQLFDLEFGSSIKNIEEFLKIILEDKWSDFVTSTKKEIGETLSNSVVNKQQAEEYLRAVTERSKGQIETPVLEVLLMCNPLFIENPVEEFNKGFKHIYRTKDHPKAKGLDIQLEYPMSWSIKEGIRPNIIKLMMANNGKGPASFSIMVRDIFAEAGSDEIRSELSQLETISGANEIAVEMFSYDSLVEMAKGMGAKNVRNITTKRIVLDRWPGAMIEFIGEQQRVDLKTTSHYQSYICLYKNYIIFIQCGVLKWPWDKGDDFQKRIDKYKPIFRKIAYNFVIQSQY
jgi:hypothetical protein